MADEGWSRREFLETAGRCGVLLASGSVVPCVTAGTSTPGLLRAAPVARYWVSTATAKTVDACRSCHDAGSVAATADHVHEKVAVRCELCARRCMLADGERGMCRARINDGGSLRSLVYGRPMSIHVDPIEKKPFYHFLPGSAAYSLSTSGCPLRCKFCQNWEISQSRPEDYTSPQVAPANIVKGATARGAEVIAFTYNEPTVFMEYLTDIAREASEAGRRSVLVSCGYMNEAPLSEMCEVLDAIKIDLKGYDEDFYREVCDAELKHVLRSIKQVARAGVHLEIVNLVVPTLNDSPKQLDELARWVAGEVGPDVPVHFTRFHPDYRLRNLPPTPVATLEKARETAMKHGIHYAFVGNVPGHPGNHTYCPGCGEIVIRRSGFFVRGVHIDSGHCMSCRTKIRGVWS